MPTRYWGCRTVAVMVASSPMSQRRSITRTVDLLGIVILTACAALAIEASVLLSAEEGGSAVLVAASLVMIAGAWLALASRHRWILAGALAALALRIGLISAISWLAAAGIGSAYVLGDELGYFDTSSSLARLFRKGIPVPELAAGAVLGRPYIDVQAMLILVFGEQNALMKVVNAALSVLAALLSYDLLRSLFDRRAGAIAFLAMAFFPTLVLWSVLNLREASIVFLLITIVWSLERLRHHPRFLWLLVGLASLAVLQGIRLYLFALSCLLYLPAVFVASRSAGLPRRIGYFALTLLVGPGFLMDAAGLGFLGTQLMRVPSTLQYLENVRSFSAVGARSAYVPGPQNTTRVVILQPGEVIEIGATSATPPTALAEIIVVKPGDVIVLVPDKAAAPSPPSGTVYVSPGDRVLLADPARPPAAQIATPRPYLMRFGDENFMQVLPEEELSGVPARLRRILSFLPRGLLYVIAAPFPGLTSTGFELPFLAEMLPWFAALVAAAGTAYATRRRWMDLLPLTSHAAALFLLLAIVEGNVGTLVRHRSMLVPFVLLLAAPTLASWGDWTRARLRGPLSGASR